MFYKISTANPTGTITRILALHSARPTSGRQQNAAEGNLVVGHCRQGDRNLGRDPAVVLKLGPVGEFGTIGKSFRGWRITSRLALAQDD